jgi:hypothetical protein
MSIVNTVTDIQKKPSLFETSVTIWHPTRRHISEDLNVLVMFLSETFCDVLISVI